MDIEALRQFCLSLPGAKEDVKWGHDLCFLIGDKMFCVTGFSPDSGVSLKVKDEEFEELSSSEGIIPAPYLARYKWIYVKPRGRFKKSEWEHYITQSYELIKNKLPAKIKARIGADKPKKGKTKKK